MYGAPKTVSSLYTFTCGCSGNAQTMNEKLLKLLISGGNRFAIRKIPQENRIVVPSPFPLLVMLLWEMARPWEPCWGCSIKVKSKRCWSIIWRTFSTGSSPVSPLLIIFFQKNSLHRHNPGNNFWGTAHSTSRNPIGHLMTTECIILKCPNINPFLLTVLYTFPLVLTRRICLIIKRFLSCWSFLVFSCP